MTTSYDKLMEKWAPVLNEESAGAITDNHRKAVTAAILENQEREMNEQSQQLHEACAYKRNCKCCELESSSYRTCKTCDAKPNGV